MGPKGTRKTNRQTDGICVKSKTPRGKFSYSDSDIIAMDETAVWQDMLSNTTVDSIGHNTIAMKTTGHEKTKVSVCLTAKADGTKLKPFIVFPGAKRETKVLNEEFKAKCVVASSSNGWMNKELTLDWVRSVLGSFPSPDESWHGIRSSAT